MRQLYKYTCLALVLQALWLIDVHAATFTSIDDDVFHCKVLMEGIIEKGDAEKLKQIIFDQQIKTYPAPNNGHPDRICLNSPGGNLLEAIEMAEIYEGNGGTAVRMGDRCESACAILFMSGSFQGEDGFFMGTDRVIHPLAKLGFHAPSLKVEDGNYAKNSVEKAYKIALAGASELNRLSSKIDIPTTLLTEMLKTPSDQMLYIEKVWQAARWDIAVAPTKPHLPLDKTGFLAACNNINERNNEIDLRTTAGRESDFKYRVDWRGGDRLSVSKDKDVIEVRYGSLTYIDDDCYLQLPAYMRTVAQVSTTPAPIRVGSGVPNDFSVKPLVFFKGSSDLADLASQMEEKITLANSAVKMTESSSMRLFTGFDLNGGDIKIIKTIEQEECLQSCDTNKDCSAVTYDRWNNICILKDFNKSSRTMLLQPKSETHVGASMVGKLKYSGNLVRFKRRDDRHFPSAAYSVTISSNREYCQKLCKSEVNCHAYGFDKYLSQCELYNLPPEYFPKKGSYIGIKEQLN